MSRALRCYSGYRSANFSYATTISLPSAFCLPARRKSSTVHASQLRFGQPLHETHPHLLAAGELTPGITALEYAQRRAKLAALLPANSIAIVAAADIVFRTGHVFYDFHQDPDFFYLTGFNEPEALAVIGKSPTDDDHTFHLFVREKDPKAEVWDGARSGTQAALDVFNADETGDVRDMKKHIAELVGDAQQIYTDIVGSQTGTSGLFDFLRGDLKPARTFSEMIEHKEVRPLRRLMNDLRVTKSDAEIRNMERAGQASGTSFTETMRNCFRGERELDIFLSHQFRVHGCDRSAFEAVAAGGVNALSIHYVRNDCLIDTGDLVLADAGGEYGGYVSDITRTWPVNGRFSPAQRDLYEVVLKVQRACINECSQAHTTTLDALHQKAERMLKEELTQLGFDMSSRTSGDPMTTLFPHHLSHHLGLDLHDCVGYSKKATLKAGQCITVEPGIYVPSEPDARFPAHFRGLGIRIEDSICVRDDEDPLVLTNAAIKEVADIEALRR